MLIQKSVDLGVDQCTDLTNVSEEAVCLLAELSGRKGVALQVKQSVQEQCG